MSGVGGGSSDDMSSIEEVLRTKWSGCRIDWKGLAKPPSID